MRFRYSTASRGSIHSLPRFELVRVARAALLLMLAVGAAGCDKKDTTEISAAPTKVRFIYNAVEPNQILAGQRFSAGVTAIVEDVANRPVGGVIVNFAATPAGGVVIDKAVTDQNGRARVEWLLADFVGEQTLTMTVAGLPPAVLRVQAVRP